MHFLKIGNSTLSFPELGIVKAKLSRKNRACDTLTVSSANSFGGTEIENLGQVELFENDTRRFVGRVEKFALSKNGGSSELSQLTIKSPWSELDSIVYQQLWKSASNYEGEVVLSDCWRSKVVLGQNSDGEQISAGEQIIDILSYAVSCGAHFQIGNVSFGQKMLLEEMKDSTCAEAISRVLKWFPDAVAWFDYSGEGAPVLNMSRSGDTEEILIDSEDENIISFYATPREDLRIDGVTIKYEKENSSGDSEWISVSEDSYPKNFNSKSSNALVMSVDLAGSKTARTIYSAVCEPIRLDLISWWKSHIPALSDFSNIEILSYERLHTDLPRELTEGCIPKGIGYTCEKDLITARVEYDSEDGTREARNVGIHLIATDASTGTFSKSATKSLAESEPVGLAQAIYEASQPLRFEGNLELSGGRSEQFAMKKISAAGFGEEFENMQSIVMSMEENIETDILKINFGPPKHIYPDKIAELYRIDRARTIPSNSNARSNGTTSASTYAEFNADIAFETPSDINAAPSRITLKTPNNTLAIDLNSSEIDENDMAKIREIFVCKDGVLCTAKILMTEPKVYEQADVPAGGTSS